MKQATKALKQHFDSKLLMRKLNGKVRLEFDKSNGFYVVFVGRKELFWVSLKKLVEIVDSFKEEINNQGSKL